MSHASQFEIRSNLDVPPKRRAPKYDWDADVIEEATGLRALNPSRSLRWAIYKVLDEILTPTELRDKETHYQRLCHRIKLVNERGVF